MERITYDKEMCGGRPCIRGMRIKVSDILDFLANGQSPQEIIADFPALEMEDIQAALKYASQRLSYPQIHAK